MASMKKNGNKILGIVLIAVVAAVVLGAVLPVGISAMVDDSVKTVNHTQGETYDIKGNLTSNATDINSIDGEATFDISHDGTTETVTLSEGDSATVHSDVNVTLDSVDSDTQATATYEVPTDFGWPTGVQALFSVLVYFVILLPFAGLASVVIDLF